MKRVQWLDSSRFLAMFYIMFGHFIADECPDFFRYWETPPTSWLLSGFIGKLFLIFFFVILGYFASKPSSFSAVGMIKYSFRRYYQLAFYIFFSTAAYIAGSYVCTWIFHSPDPEAYRIICDGFHYNFIYLFRDSFLCEANYNASLWCIPHLIIGSIVCKLLACIPQKIRLGYRFSLAAALIVVLMLIDPDTTLWVCITILGYLLRLTLEWLDTHPGLINSRTKGIALIICLIIIKIPLEEGTLLFSLEAIVNFFVLIVLFYSPKAQTLLSKAPLPWLGKLSIGLFVVHPLIYSLIDSSIYPLMLGCMSKSLALPIHYLLSMSFSFLAAWALDIMYSSTNIFFKKIFAKA